jgi:hypothetical protein
MLHDGAGLRPGSGSGTNKQERFSNHKYIERERQVVKYQEGRAGRKERGLRGTKAGSVERPGEDAPAQIQFQDLAEISRSS